MMLRVMKVILMCFERTGSEHRVDLLRLSDILSLSLLSPPSHEHTILLIKKRTLCPFRLAAACKEKHREKLTAKRVTDFSGVQNTN